MKGQQGLQCNVGAVVDPITWKIVPSEKRVEHVSQLYEASIVGDVGWSLPKINVALEDRQVEY